MKATWKTNRVNAVFAAAILVCTAGGMEAANWRIDMVDQSGTGQFTSLKVDSEGNAHMAYVIDDNRAALKYAFLDHRLQRWFTMKVAEGASFPSLVLDSKQRPHISWADAGTVPGCKLRYAYWDGTSAWKQEAIPLPAETVAYYTSLAMDAHDNPSISYYEYDGPRGTDKRVRMRVVIWNGRNWVNTLVDGSNQSGKFSSLAVDARGFLHLAYANVNAGTAGMRYGLWDGSSWKLEVVDAYEQVHAYVGQGAYIVLDKAGDPHISYLNVSYPSVRYAVRKDGHWTIQVVDRMERAGYPDRNALALDNQDRPYLAYYDAGLGLLRFAHREGTNWLAETVDGNGSGYTSSLQVDNDTVWISYADTGSGGVKVARAALTDVWKEGKGTGNQQANSQSGH
jgi:hypothetical protein